MDLDELPHRSGDGDATDGDDVEYSAGDDDDSIDGDGDEPERVERKRPGWIGGGRPIRHHRLLPPNLVSRATDPMSSYRLRRWKNYWQVPWRRSRFSPHYYTNTLDAADRNEKTKSSQIKSNPELLLLVALVVFCWKKKTKELLSQSVSVGARSSRSSNSMADQRGLCEIRPRKALVDLWVGISGSTNPQNPLGRN